MDSRRALSMLVALGVVLGVSVAPTGTADTTEPWLAPARLGLGQEPVVAASAEGDVVAAWRSVENGGVVRASFRPAGGRWQPVVEWPGFVSGPRVAIDRRGNAIVVWIAYRESHAIVEASVRPAGKRWTAPTPLSSASEWATSPRVAMDASGNALVAWRSTAWPEAIQTRYRSVQAGAWRPPVGVSSYAYSELELAMAPGGRALLTWDVSKEIGHAVAVVIGERGQWSEPREVGGVENGTTYEERPKALAPAIGDTVAVLAWQYAIHGNGIVKASLQTAAGAWEPAVDLSFPDGQAFGPAVAIDGTGAVLATWDANVDVEGSTRRPGAPSWDRPSVVSPSKGAPRLGANARGDAVALWPSRDPPFSGVGAARKPAGSTGWETTAKVAPAGRIGATGVAVDGAGDAVAVWEVNDGRWWVEVAASDVAPPIVTALAVPRAGLVRKPVRFSVVARDTWSRVTAPSWRFGDGSRGRGAVVTHRYRAPGSYRVSVAVADALGHVTTKSRVIRIRL